MEITVPKLRSEKVWEQNMKKLLDYRNTRFTFKDYCEFSFLFIEADDSIFLKESKNPIFKKDPKLKEDVERLLNTELNYTIFVRDQKKRQEFKKEQDTARKIVKGIAYAWQTIIDLINGKANLTNTAQDSLGIYNDANINLHFARLEEMLLELKSKRYRPSVYVKENAYTREMTDKEMEQELVFIKLLQSILQNQTKNIREARKKFKEATQQQEDQEEVVQEVEEIEEKLPSIREIVKVEEYFERKLAMKELANTSKDPIDRQAENRKFNAAAIRYHLHHNHARR